MSVLALQFCLARAAVAQTPAPKTPTPTKVPTKQITTPPKSPTAAQGQTTLPREPKRPSGPKTGGPTHARRPEPPPPRTSTSERKLPVGSHETRAANGAIIRTRADRTRSDVRDEERGIYIHHGLNGGRRISVERADHSRVFAERGGRSFVQHPYIFHGREFGHRTYFDHGRAYDRYYNRYGYRGTYLDVYAPARYYPAGFYGWAYNPWSAPVAYSWGWGAAPWYGNYGGYFAPYPVYPSAAFWLTDYLIATSLQAAFAAQAADAQQAAMTAGVAPVLTPEIKKMVSDEVQATGSP